MKRIIAFKNGSDVDGKVCFGIKLLSLETSFFITIKNLK